MWRGESEHALWMFTTRIHNQGTSVGNYRTLNIATHVGDYSASVQENRSAVAAMMRVTPEAIVWPELIHSTLSLEIQLPSQKVTPADITYTTNPEIVLATMSADCVPLIAISNEKPFALTAHIGWKGAAANIAKVIVDIFEERKLKEVEIYLGPAICGECYQVSIDRLQQVAETLPGSMLKSGLDLRRGLSQFFEGRGIRVELVGPCTFESDELFSFRRNHTTGRQAALVKLR